MPRLFIQRLTLLAEKGINCGFNVLNMKTFTQ